MSVLEAVLGLWAIIASVVVTILIHLYSCLDERSTKLKGQLIDTAKDRAAILESIKDLYEEWHE